MKKIISILTAVMMLITLSAPVFASSYNDWDESSYVEESVKNAFTMSKGEYSFEATDSVRRMDAAITAARLLEEIKGRELSGDKSSLKKFEDYREVLDDYDSFELEYLGKAAENGILKGVAEDDGDYVYPEDSATRAEMAAFFARLIKKSGLDLSDSYRTKSFNDLEDHWAKKEVDSVVKVGLMEGESSRTFGVDKRMKYEDFLIVIYRMCVDETDELDIEDFIDAVNDCRWVFLEVEDSDGSYFNLRDIDPLEVGESEKIRVSTDISGFINSDADWYSSDERILTVDSQGKVTARKAGTVKVTAEYGKFSDTITVRVISSDENDPESTPTPRPTNKPSKKEMTLTQSIVSLEVGDTIDLDDYVINAPGDVDYQIASGEAYISLDGTIVEGIKATPDNRGAVVIISSEDQEKELIIKVIDNHPMVPAGVSPTVTWEDDNSTGSVYFTIKGINSDCEVKLNANGEYKAVKLNDSSSTWANYKVENLEEIGGTSALVVRVIVDNQQVWESDPHIVYFGD